VYGDLAGEEEEEEEEEAEEAEMVEGMQRHRIVTVYLTLVQLPCTLLNLYLSLGVPYC
jgi:hypothetical protein